MGPQFWLRRSVFSTVSLILAGGFAYLAYCLYRVADRTTDFIPMLAEYALQISVIALLGAAIKEVVDWRNAARVQSEQRISLRSDFLRRLREIDSKVSHSRYLMRAHNSAKTWSEQSRSLIERIPELVEVLEDLRASPGLFNQQRELEDGIEGMITYLEGCGVEYEAKHAALDADGKRGTALLNSIGAHKMQWVADFFHGRGFFESEYVANLQRAKNLMRNAVFGEH